MLFTFLNSPFCHVESMVVWFDKLEVAFFLGKEIFNLSCRLVVHNVHFYFVALAAEVKEVSSVHVCAKLSALIQEDLIDVDMLHMFPICQSRQ